MLSFVEYLQEHVLSIGLNPKHEKYREQHRSDMHSILQKSYSHPDIGGYGGLKSGSKEESDMIHHDITHSKIKAVVRDGKVTAVNLYKDRHGRKLIAAATDQSSQGKEDWKSLVKDDHKQKRSWAEVSGAVEHVFKKIGMPKIHNSKAKELTGKENIKPVDNERYSRKIGNSEHEKIIMGHPKI